MTSIVGIRCIDGVVIGSDSAATSADGSGQLRTMELSTSRKIEIINSKIIIATTGSVGYAQRFSAVVKDMWEKKTLSGKTAIECGKLLSAHGIKDFLETHKQEISLTAFVAFPAKHEPELIELTGWASGFQPERKDPNDLWFCSAGIGQPITDPFLALLRKVFCPKGPPTLGGGIFMALWALMHVCEINPGGINEPIKIAVLAGKELTARMLDDAELAEHRNLVNGAMAHMASFRDILDGKTAATPPEPEKS